MVLRKLAMALLSLGVVLPGLTHALALREVKTKSALGEPFIAEIELSDLGDLTEEDIKVSLAQAEDFERLGIEQVYILAELRFQVVINQGGRSYVKITTHKRMTEPFLDFIVRVSWPNNTRLQQVTALLDPPVSKMTRTAEQPAPPVVVQTPPVIQPVAPVVPAIETVAVAPSNERSYQVKTNDTLWSVARRVRPSPAISVSKMMKVLHKANPQAFIANNINLLKNGQVLRVPSLMDTQSANSNKLAAQSTATPLQGQAPTKPLSQQQIDATAHAKSIEKTVSTPRVQMKLVAPVASQSKNSDISKANPQNTDAKSSQGGLGVSSIANGSEKVQTVTKPTHKLSKELAALENKLKLNDKKIAMQNAKLAHLEAQLKARRLAAEQAKQQDKKTDLDKKAVATLACAVAMQSLISTDAKAADEVATTVAPATPAKTEGGGMMMPIIGVGALIVIIALIFFFKGKAKKEQPPVRPTTPTPPVANPQATAKPAVAAPVAKKPEPAKPQDPLEEVRPYLEMERYPQAVGILTKALVQHPDRADIHLKLLEIFAKQKDRTSFNEQYTKLETVGDLDAIVAADKLKNQFPEEVKPAAPIPKEGALEFTSTPKVAESVVEEAPAMSLDDLENDFKMSLSQPNLKALDIPLALDPIELQRPEIGSPSVEEAKISELDSLLGGGLEFKFDKPAEFIATEPSIDEPVVESKMDLDFSFDAPAAEEAKPSIDIGTGLSLDSLDDFLSEHKAEPKVVEPELTPAANLDFEQELAKFKEEKHEPNAEANLTEGFELEEFKFDKENDLDFDVADVDFSIDEQPVVEEAMDFGLDVDAPSVDLSDMVANFDKEELTQDVGLPDDLNFDDVDVSVSSDDVLAELDKEFSFLATTNENSTRLELARAYMEMGDRLGARDLLEEVVAEGSGEQKTEAQGMLMRIG
jgi:pilus assembly protein FimV